MNSLVARLNALEADVRYQEPASPGEPEFRYERGQIPVLVSAPHGAVHTREGQIKAEDSHSAGLARLLGQESGAHVLYTRRQSATDPNWYAGVPYKLCLAEIVRREGVGFVMDVHGAAYRRNFGIALGTLSGRSCPRQRDTIIRVLEASGFRQAGYRMGHLDVDYTFTANGKERQETVTRYVWNQLGVPAAQFEINGSLCVVQVRADASGLPHFLATREHVAQVVQALCAVIQAVR